ncbi:MAG: pyridoxal phosphate-dependent aminotransferase [Burkholderiales bacterium]
MNADTKHFTPNLRIAQRMAEIAPFHVVELFNRVGELERAGHHVVNLCIGEPDFPTPQPMLDAAAAALKIGRFPYTASLGMPELRLAIAKFYLDRYNVVVTPERVVVTAGASGALLLTMGVLVNAGETVLLTDPGYPCNQQFVRMMGGVPFAIPVDSSTGYQLNTDLVNKHWTADTVAALVASPANPTGTMINANAMGKLIAAVASKGGRLIVDEIYLALNYGEAATSALTLSDEVFIINSFSKYFQMTGWRLGWLIAPSGYVREIEKLAQNLFISNSTIAQHAALASFAPETLELLEARRHEFKARRDYLIPALQDLGFGVPVVPEGAFYVYADCSRFTKDSYRFCWDLLEKAHVAVTPGIDFGSHRAAHHMRFSYCTAIEELKEGVARIKHYLAGY